MKDMINKPTKNNTTNNFQQKIVFDEEKVTEYKDTLKQNFNDLESNISPETSVNMHAEILTNFIYENALKIFGKKIPIETKKKHKPPTRTKMVQHRMPPRKTGL